MSNNNKLSMRLGFGEKIGYACGDMASNFYWRIFDLYLFIFYTDVFNIPAEIVGTMMLVTRIIDAVTDPVMGAISDRTKTRFGMFRPYLILGILPLAAAGVLMFTVPNLEQDGKILWAYGTYIFMMISYTFINIPYGALIGVMTSNSQDRTALTSFRFIGAFTGGSIVAWALPELVVFFGQGDEKLGWQMSMMLFGVLAGFLFLISFLSTRERIAPPPQQKSSVVQDLKDLADNKPWLILFSLALIIMVTITLRGSSGAYYIKYVVGKPELVGTFGLVYMLSLAFGALMTPILTRFFDKKKLLLILMACVGVLSVAFYFVPKDQVALIFIMHAAIGICLGPKSPLVFSMYADTADYTEWSKGRRATAMTFAAATFSQKMGGAIAGAIIGWLLGYLGYAANQVQSNASEHGIVLLLTVIPGIFAFISVFVVNFYHLDAAQLEKIQADLVERKALL